LEQKVVDLTMLTAAVVEKAAAADAERATTDAAVTAAIPGAVEALVQHGRIEPGQAEKCAALLKNPVRVLEILTKVAGHRNDAERTAQETRLGAPAQPAVKAASYSGAIGGRAPEDAESNRSMLAAFGLTPG
jgi:hypothetical protein